MTGFCYSVALHLSFVSIYNRIIQLYKLKKKTYVFIGQDFSTVVLVVAWKIVGIHIYSRAVVLILGVMTPLQVE